MDIRKQLQHNSACTIRLHMHCTLANPVNSYPQYTFYNMRVSVESRNLKEESRKAFDTRLFPQD